MAGSSAASPRQGHHTTRAREGQLSLPLDAAPPATAAAEAQTLPPLEIRRHPRARRLSIRVHPGGRVVVVTPPRTGPDTVARFVRTHRDWIIHTAREMAPAAPPALPDRLALPALGESLRVELDSGERGRAPRWHRHGDVLVLRAAEDSPAAALPLLRDWLRERARETGPGLVAAVSAETGLVPSRVQFRLQRSRWGSCSSRGTVSLNACMLFLEPRELRYLVLHELCHLKHMHHGPAFWALVARHEPQCRAIDRGLNAAWRRVPGWVFAQP